MAPPLSHQVAEQIEKARQLYHRLVIVAGSPRSGKTAALHDLHDAHGWPLVNLNLALAEKLPDAVLQEDEKLLMYYDNALTRLGGE